MENQCIFSKYFTRALSETVTTGVAGIGGMADSQFSGDTWAPGDSRIPKSVFGGTIIKRSGGKKKGKRRTRRKKR